MSTTADCWTAHRRSFIGITVHWIGNDLLRKSACLGIKRIIGSHTYDVIAKSIDDLHNEFGIGGKITSTITDNGSNFIKAFNVYGTPKTVEAEVGDSNRDERQDLDITAETINEDSSDEENDEDYVFIDLGSILENIPTRVCSTNEKPDNQVSEGARAMESEDEEMTFLDDEDEDHVILPPHMRCNCHLLNLIACADTNKISNPTFKRLKRIVDSKLKSVWNKQSRSSLSSDFIKEKLGKLFVLPNQTRWNSYYDAIVRVNEFIVDKNS